MQGPDVCLRAAEGRQPAQEHEDSRPVGTDSGRPVGTDPGVAVHGAPRVDDEEVEEGRAPRTRECPESMSSEDLRTHSLTHIPYHPGCKCCVAARKRDHKHSRRTTGTIVDVETSGGASVCADYFFPRDRPGEASVTALAVCDSASQFLAGHIVDSKGASAEHAVKQVLRDLRKMGHYGDLKVRMDQESSIFDQFRAVAKERGVIPHRPHPCCPQRLQRGRPGGEGRAVYRGDGQNSVP